MVVAFRLPRALSIPFVETWVLGGRLEQLNVVAQSGRRRCLQQPATARLEQKVLVWRLEGGAHDHRDSKLGTQPACL